MKTQSGRLIELINQLNLNTRSFAMNCGFSQPTTIYSVIKNDSKLTKSTLDRICNRFPQVNKDWLLTGHGNMFNSLSEKKSSDDLTVTAKQSIDGIVLELEKKEVLSNDKLDLLIKKIDNIHERLLGLEYLKGLELKSKAKKKNGI